MCHSGDINEIVHHVPAAIREVIRIGKHLDSVDKGEISYFNLTLLSKAEFPRNVSI